MRGLGLLFAAVGKAYSAAVPLLHILWPLDRLRRTQRHTRQQRTPRLMLQPRGAVAANMPAAKRNNWQQLCAVVCEKKAAEFRAPPLYCFQE
jgi:hypothetical protein